MLEAGVFKRYISIDWSGAGTESKRGGLRIVESSPNHPNGRVVDPVEANPRVRAGTRSWTRAECKDWLAEALRQDQPRCLIAMDFGFGYPWGADGAVFGCRGWREMLGAVAERYHEQERAESAAKEINSRIEGSGPYRFSLDRSDFRFYLDNGVAYYRMVETLVPQAISQWYLGAGPRVGSSTITGLATLDHLMVLRDQGEIEFQVWPQECNTSDGARHIMVESYPAIYPEPQDFGGCRENDEHCHDAWKALQWMLQKAKAGTLGRYFNIAPKPFGRVEGIRFEEQVRFEGWIFGVL